MPDVLSLRLFGPLHLQTDSGPAQIQRLQVRLAMVLLALEPGRVWTLDELIEEMWPQDLPASPRRAIQVVVSRLRHALEAYDDVLRSERGGWAINPAQVEVDIVRFDELVAQALAHDDPAEVIALTQAGLELWRGAPFADSPSSPLLDSVCRGLEENRRLATNLLVEALVEVGDPDRAVVVARPAFDADPAQERLAMSLARALAAEGRRAEALEVIDRSRSQLRHEAGLDPSPALDDLEQLILNTAVDLSRSPRHSGSGGPSVFVGREADVDQLLVAARDARPLTVVGDGGLGKSSVLAQARRCLETDGRPVVWVTVDPEPARPADTVASVVTALLEQDHAPKGDAAATAISRVVPGQAANRQIGSEISREGIVDELARFIIDSAAAAGVVIFIDDLHLLDRMSAEVLVTVARSGACALLAAARPSTDPQLAPFLTEPTAHELAPLGAEAVQDYLDERYGAHTTSLEPAELHDRCGGNPLFLGLLVDLHLDGAIDEASLPRSLLVAVRERLDSLSDRTIETLQVASALGTQFSLEALRSWRPTTNVDLAEAAEARLVAVDETGEGRFIHGLVAEAAYQLMPPGRRIEVHDRLAQILLDLGASPIDYASHATQAAGLDPYRAANANLAAGRAFATAHVLDIAAKRFSLGLQILEGQSLGATPLAAELAVDLGQVQRLAADPAHLETLEGAARLAQEIQAPELLARAVIELCSHGGTTLGGQVDHTILGLIDAALDSAASLGAKAELMASVPTLTALSSHYRRGQRLYREAIELAARSGDPDLEARVLVRAHLGLSHPDDFERRVEATDRLEEVAGTDVDIGWEVAYLRFNTGLITGDPELMASSVGTLENLTPRAQHRHLGLAHLRSTYAHVIGNLDEAERLLDEATNLAMTIFPASWALAHYSSIIFAIRDCQGRLGELVGAVESFLEDLPDLSNWRAGLALAAAQTGDLDIALREFDAFALDDFATLTEDVTWSAASTSLGRVAAILGDDVASERLYEILLPHQGRMSWLGTGTLGPNDYALGVLARTMGNHEQAARHFATADALSRRLTNEHYLTENRLRVDFPQS